MSRFSWILVALALAARLFLVFNTQSGLRPGPIPEFNDEHAHMNYVRFVAECGRLPVQIESVQEGFERGEFEYYQAPLYYLLTSPFYAIGHELTPGREIYWARLVSVIFSVAGLIVLFLSVRSLLGDPLPAASVLILGAFSGVPLRFGSTVTNDSLLFLISCLYFALILEIMRSGCDLRLLFAGALTAAAGLWTKASFLIILPLFPFVLLLGPKRAVWKTGLALLLPLLAILPWYLRNQHLYGAWMPLTVGSGAPEVLSLDNFFERAALMANYFVRSLVFPFDELWGGLPDMIIYPFEGLLFLVLLILGVRDQSREARGPNWIFMFAIALNLIGYFYFNYFYTQADARLFIPALPFIFALLALGAHRLFGKRKSRAVFLLGLWILLPWLTVLI